MCRSVHGGGGGRGTFQGEPLDREPPGQRPPQQISPGHRPPGQRPPPRQRPSGQRPPQQISPGQRPLDIDPPPSQTETPWTETPYTVRSGWHASYWNAFLFYNMSLNSFLVHDWKATKIFYISFTVQYYCRNLVQKYGRLLRLNESLIINALFPNSVKSKPQRLSPFNIFTSKPDTLHRLADLTFLYFYYCIITICIITSEEQNKLKQKVYLQWRLNLQPRDYLWLHSHTLATELNWQVLLRDI